MIYVASPYSHPNEAVRIERFNKVSQFVAELVYQGHCPISPITYGHTLLSYKDMPTDFEFWNNFCLSLLSKSDTMYVYMIDGWKESKGLNAEIEFAENNNIKIEYIEEIIIEKEYYIKSEVIVGNKYFISGEERYIAEDTGYEYGWSNDVPVLQFGKCKKCKIKLASWAKDAECPKCFTNNYLT
jgi:hypothetical protein